MTGLEIMVLAALIIAINFGLGVLSWTQHREIERLQSDVRWHQKDAQDWYQRTCKVSVALEAIAAATADINHGTARKVHRIATEALNG